MKIIFDYEDPENMLAEVVLQKATFEVPNGLLANQMLDVWKWGMAAMGYHPGSVDDAIEEEAYIIREVRGDTD